MKPAMSLLLLALPFPVLAAPPATTTSPATAPLVAPDYSAFILTPPPAPAPRINAPARFGVRPNSPFLFTIPATGDRPLSFAADDLPRGLTLNPQTGQITGVLGTSGTLKLTLHASNAKGTAAKPFTIVVGDTLALTPPMGWNSWNCWASAVDQEKVLSSAHAMVSSGLINHGWTYINIDDAWQGDRDPTTHALQPDVKKFPDIKAMADEIHALGLKTGIYSTPWVKSYAGRLGESAENPEGAPQTFPGPATRNKKVLPYAIGKFHFAATDAKQWAGWGIDYLKYDWGPVEAPEAQEMADAVRGSGRDVLFSLSNNSVGNVINVVPELSKFANAWRTTKDITDAWSRVQDIGFSQTPWETFQSPGHYNDPDMLVVGFVGWGPKLHFSKLTPAEQYTHITLWCMLSAPLLIGCDLARLDPFTLNLLTNDEVLALDQDPLVQPARLLQRDGDVQIYLKDLDDGSHALAFFNLANTPAQYVPNYPSLRFENTRARDLWRQKDLPTLPATIPLNPHGTMLYKLPPAH